MYNRRPFKCIIAAVTCIAMLLCLTYTVCAQERGSITLTLVDRETKEPVGFGVFRIYKFADAEAADGGYRFSYDEGYLDCGINISGLLDPYFAIHITAHAQLNGLSYTEKRADENGVVVFDGLEPGAYLVLPMGGAEGYITSSPFVVTLPSWDELQAGWFYDVHSRPKTEPDTDIKESYLSVKKEWSSEEGVENPASVTVVLLKDCEIVDTVTLSDANNWYYRWDGLAQGHDWNVAEIAVPRGYEVGYSDSEMTVIVTNVKLEHEPPTDGSNEETDDSTRPEDTTSTPPATTTRPDGTTKPTDQLIQTGQLNWPVPILAISGLLLFALGWVLYEPGVKEEDSE